MTKTAVITGGAQGIGRIIVGHLLSDGWRVVALDRDEVALAELLDAHQGAALLAVTCDVGVEADVEEAFRRLHEWQSGDATVHRRGIRTPVSG